MRKVCVFGSYKSPEGKEKEEIAKLGRLLAENGFTVVTGGFGGTMEEVSRGAKEGGGKTIGVTFYKKKVLQHVKVNKYVDKEIVANDIFERIKIMMEISDAFIVLAGGTGTLLELAACLEHINKGIMEPKPIIALGNYWRTVTEKLAGEAILCETAKSRLGAISCQDLLSFAPTPEKAVETIVTSLS